MNQESFIREFQAIAGQHVWSNLLTKPRGSNWAVLNPVTAVCLDKTGILFRNTKRETARAARHLGITQELAMAIYSKSNRGHSQIIRGKLLRAIGQ